MLAARFPSLDPNSQEICWRCCALLPACWIFMTPTVASEGRPRSLTKTKPGRGRVVVPRFNAGQAAQFSDRSPSHEVRLCRP